MFKTERILNILQQCPADNILSKETVFAARKPLRVGDVFIRLNCSVFFSKMSFSHLLQYRELGHYRRLHINHYGLQASGSQTFLVRGPLEFFQCSAKHKIQGLADHLSYFRGPLVVVVADFGNHCSRLYMNYKLKNIVIITSKNPLIIKCRYNYLNYTQPYAARLTM